MIRTVILFVCLRRLRARCPELFDGAAAAAAVGLVLSEAAVD